MKAARMGHVHLYPDMYENRPIEALVKCAYRDIFARRSLRSGKADQRRATTTESFEGRPGETLSHNNGVTF